MLKAKSSGNTLPVQIGRNGRDTGKFFHGKLDDVRIWNVVRQQAEITAGYRNELGGPQIGLVANWWLDGTNGAVDSSGHGHDAVLTGNATFSSDLHP